MVELKGTLSQEWPVKNTTWPRSECIIYQVAVSSTTYQVAAFRRFAPSYLPKVLNQPRDSRISHARRREFKGAIRGEAWCLRNRVRAGEAYLLARLGAPFAVLPRTAAAAAARQ